MSREKRRRMIQIKDSHWTLPRIRNPVVVRREGCKVSSLLLVGLLVLDALNPAFLLRFELVVEEEESLLVVLGQARDDEHAFTRVVVGSLGDRDARTREATDLVDLRSTASDDASTASEKEHQYS